MTTQTRKQRTYADTVPQGIRFGERFVSYGTECTYWGTDYGRPIVTIDVPDCYASVRVGDTISVNNGPEILITEDRDFKTKTEYFDYCRTLQ